MTDFDAFNCLVKSDPFRLKPIIFLPRFKLIDDSLMSYINYNDS